MSAFGAAIIPDSPVNRFIVAFKPDTNNTHVDEAIKKVESQGGKVVHRYEAAFLGFAAELPVDAI
ncbi:hypothetical protein BGZ94_010353, partial [Podila epigama]